MKPESPKIADIRERFKSSLLDKADVLGGYLDKIVESEELNVELLSELREDLHKLAGSTGMYGYDDLAKMSREAMDLIDAGDEFGSEQKVLAIHNLLKQYAKK